MAYWDCMLCLVCGSLVSNSVGLLVAVDCFGMMILLVPYGLILFGFCCLVCYVFLWVVYVAYVWFILWLCGLGAYCVRCGYVCLF